MVVIAILGLGLLLLAAVWARHNAARRRHRADAAAHIELQLITTGALLQMLHEAHRHE